MPPSKRRRGRRAGWSRLTASYRGRLERSGITRAHWEAGGDLRVARGHTPQPPAGAAPFEATMRSVTNAATDADQRVLREFRGPAWIPEDVSDDVRAALSQLRGVPRDWAAVRFIPAAEGEPWAMVVTPKRAVRHPDGTSPYDQVVLIPGGGAPGTGAREVLDLFSHPESAGVDPSDRRWQGWVSGNVRVAERLAEPSVGYGERADVMHQVEILLEEWRKT